PPPPAAAPAPPDPRSRGFNPLFIYGGSGLGKTHLMQAIGHCLYERDNRLRVTYITSEQFINNFINAIQNRTHVDFRAMYRNCDLLLIDDVQFLQGKERTQQEFFHTFNALYDAGKRVVVTSDRPPKELATLEERLRSRFEWGLLVDIQPPDLETRIAILRKKAKQEGVNLSSDVIHFIAEHITENIREIEGALKRLHMAASLHDCQIDLERARTILGHLIVGNPQPKVSVEDIQRSVCEYFKINLSDLLGSGRSKRVSQPRHMAQYLSRKLTDLSFPDIAQKFGGKDHTSIIYAVRKVERDMEKDSNVASIVNHLTRRVTKGAD
ncbi:MAG: chromosomal replication initiator protein DnaA, partial [Candidatus Sumerlaeia bacterium]|nr:chromosomal replication initiator protein DnaA [Candidatus Sumerlaeia bacterium]